MPCCEKSEPMEYEAADITPTTLADETKVSPAPRPATFAEVNLPKPIVNNGKFSHPWEYQMPGVGKLLSWQTGIGAPEKTPKKPPFPSKEEASKKLPTVEKIDPLVYRYRDQGEIALSGEDLTATWTGHASFLVQYGGISILTDPVFSQRASPVSFAGPKRMVPPPIPVAQLPHIDIVTISHNHYDHLCTSTVKDLIAKFNPIFVVPTKMKERWFDKCDFCQKDRVFELSWWQGITIDLPPLAGGAKQRSLTIHATPVQHWSKRTPRDDFMELWVGFMYDIGSKRVFHSGDTGYCSIFKTIGEAFGHHIDFAMLPIGAYEPRWFMRPQHVDPKEAVMMHQELGSKFSVGMHWGTFILTDEPIDEPPKLLAESLAEAELAPDCFVAPKHGETFVVKNPTHGDDGV